MSSRFWGPALVVVLGLAYVIGKPLYEQGQTSVSDPHLPWLIDVKANGTSEVLGVTLGETTLAQLLALNVNDNEVAIISDRSDNANLEAYFASFDTGPLTGKLVASIAVEPELLLEMMETADHSSYMATGARQFMLNADHLLRAMALPVRTMNYIPSVNLDVATLQKLFGEPQQTQTREDGIKLLFYPEKGLIISLHEKSKEVFHYIAPRSFSDLEAAISAYNVPE